MTGRGSGLRWPRRPHDRLARFERFDRFADSGPGPRARRLEVGAQNRARDVARENAACDDEGVPTPIVKAGRGGIDATAPSVARA